MGSNPIALTNKINKLLATHKSKHSVEIAPGDTWGNNRAANVSIFKVGNSMKKRGHDPRLIADAMIASDLMEQTKNYLERGRKFESLTVDQLKDKWVMDFKMWRNTGNSKEMDDTYAELRLRDIEAPFERVQAERAAMIDEIKQDRPDNPGILAKIEKFLEAFKKPRN